MNHGKVRSRRLPLFIGSFRRPRPHISHLDKHFLHDENIFKGKSSPKRSRKEKMAAPTLPPITSLPTLPLPDQLKAIDTLFEPSPELHNILQPILSNAQTFQSYDDLIDEVHNKLSSLSATNDPQQKQTLYGILGSHPRLGAASPTAQAGLSELSRREQANINKSTDEQAAADQAARLSALNKEYEEKYPGLRYVYDPLSNSYDFFSFLLFLLGDSSC
jgi:hypothetical protein